MNRILRELCEASLVIDDHDHLLTSKDLSRMTEISRKEVLKELKTLKSEGMVGYVRTVLQTWDGPAFNQGWSITRNAITTPEFDAALDKETAWCLHFLYEETEGDPWNHSNRFMSMRSVLDWRKKK